MKNVTEVSANKRFSSQDVMRHSSIISDKTVLNSSLRYSALVPCDMPFPPRSNATNVARQACSKWQTVRRPQRSMPSTSRPAKHSASLHRQALNGRLACDAACAENAAYGLIAPESTRSMFYSTEKNETYTARPPPPQTPEQCPIKKTRNLPRATTVVSQQHHGWGRNGR